MKKKILIGSIIAVVILTLVSFSSVVGYNSVENNPDATPIEFEFQRIRELVQSIDLRKIIVNPDAVIDTLVEISTIIEENEDCGCEDESTLEGNFPVICTILYPVFIFALYLYHTFGITFLGNNIGAIGLRLNCFWTRL